MNEVTYAFAESGDESQIRELLIVSGLPEEDIHSHVAHFILAKISGTLVGCVGLEPAGESALLRSLAVLPDFRSRGVAGELCLRIAEHARSRGYRTLYLLTTTAPDYFQKRGYLPMERNEAPEGIRKTEQFRSLCPSSATLMKTSL